MQAGISKYLLLITCFSIFFSYISYSENNVDSLLIKLQNKNLDPLDEAILYFDVGKTYFELGDYPTALQNASIALNQFEKIKQNRQYSLTLKLIGDIYSDVNDFDKSLEYYFDAMYYAERVGDDEVIAGLNAEIGKLFVKILEFEKALGYYKLSISFYESNQDKYSGFLVTNYANIGVVYANLNELENALVYFEKAYHLYPEDDYVNRGGVLNNIGALKYKKKEFDEAMQYYINAYNMFVIAEAENGIGISLFNIAQILLETNDNYKAEEYFQKSIPYLESAGELFYLYKCYQQLSDFNELRGNVEESLKYHKLYSVTKDSIMNVETINKISSLQMQYEIRKVEHKIQILEKDAKLKRIKEYVLWGSIALIIIISSLLYFNLRNKIKNNKLNQKILSQEKEKLEKELEYKNKELENFALHIVQKNELLNSLRDDIKSVGQDFGKLKNVLMKINQNLYLQKDREEFHSHLEKIHESFFLKLNERFPELTLNDKRLCALLAIDLSTKDIAAIVNISPDSVKKSRYRLRKKLGIETEDNLAKFLKNL